MDAVSELDRTLARVEAFFDRLPLRPHDRTVLDPTPEAGVQAIVRACGHPLPDQLAHLLRRGLRVGDVGFHPEDAYDDEEVFAEGFAETLIGSPAPRAPVRAPGALPYARSADEHSSKQTRDQGFGGFEVIWSAEDVAARVARDRELAREIDQPALLESVVAFQVRPHYRVRLTDGAVVFATDDGLVELAPSLSAFFDAWLEVGCFRSHDFRTYARGLARLVGWTPPAPGTAMLLRKHDEIYRTRFFREPVRS